MTWAPEDVDLPPADERTVRTTRTALAELAARGFREPFVEAEGDALRIDCDEEGEVEVRGHVLTARVLVRSVTYYVEDEAWEMSGEDAGHVVSEMRLRS